MKQRSIARTVEMTGVGLHSGASVRLQLRPAAVNTGLRFVRDGHTILVSPETAVESPRATRLVAGDLEVLTPEHLLSACFGLGIANLEMVLDGPEVPIADGSAMPFVDLLNEAGVVEQDAPWLPLTITEPMFIEDKGSSVLLRPASSFHITYVASYPHPLVGTQILELTTDDYARQIAPARTFGFIEEVEALRAQGLAQGGSLDCAVVVYPDRYSSPLRFPDELGRHKVLDLMGDLALLGRPLAAHVTAVKSSHRLHTRLVKALAATLTCLQHGNGRSL